MQNNKLHKLGKTELLEIIYEQEQKIEQLNKKIQDLNKELEDRTIKIQEAGSIAEASIKLNQIFETAQKAADEYLKNIKSQNMINQDYAEKNISMTKEKEILEEPVENAIKEQKEENKEKNVKKVKEVEKSQSNIIIKYKKKAVKAWKDKLSNRIKEKIKRFVNIIKDISKKAKNVIKNTFIKFICGVKNLFIKIISLIIKAKNKIASFVKRIFKSIISFFIIIWKAIVNFNKILINAIKKFFIILFKKIKRAIKKAKYSTIRNLRNLKKTLKRWKEFLSFKIKTMHIEFKDDTYRIKQAIKSQIGRIKPKKQEDNELRNKKYEEQEKNNKIKRRKKKSNFDAKNFTICMGDLETEIKRRKKTEAKIKTITTFTFAIIVIIAFAIILSNKIFYILQVNGDSMAPTLDSGDLLVTSKIFGYKKGDVIAFYYNDNVLIKRVIATEGDIVNIDDEGNVYVNNIKLEENYVDRLAYGNCDIILPYKVPEGGLFLLGDNREDSIDSRNKALGSINVDKVIGRISIRINKFKIY